MAKAADQANECICRKMPLHPSFSGQSEQIRRKIQNAVIARTEHGAVR